MTEATARSWTWADSVAALVRPRRLLRDARVIVPVCILLICGSFAGAALLQMRLDRIHALDQAAEAQAARSSGIAMGIGRSLARYARMAEIFADSPQLFRSADLGRAEPAIRDIAVYDRDGSLAVHLQPLAPAPALPRFSGARWAAADALAFRRMDQTLMVRFDPASLRVASTQVLATAGAALPQGSAAQVPDWPLWVVTRPDESGALWPGALPLYLFLILGPAVAAAWLAVLLVGVFERQARAARSLKALKSTRPVEARLMVRLANAERGAAEALRAKSEFIAHMSHELRTPLNAVIGFSEVIAEAYYGDPGHPKYAEYARDIQAAGHNLHAKIGDILEFANIEAGHFPLAPGPVELSALARSCLDEHQGRAFSRRIDLALGFEEPGLVRADPLALKRIVSNLLVNALAYTAEGGMVRADIRFEEGAGVFSLRDTGAGFSATEAGRAGLPFERFDRADTVTGAGLGLAIAMELARRMGGAMRLAGEPGRGAVMEVRLPRL